MKILNILSVLSLVAFVSACGSSTQPTNTLTGAQTGYYNPSYNYGNGTQGGYGSMCGTKTATQVLGGSFYTNSGSYNFYQTAQVAAGDIVIVQATNTSVQTISSTFIPVNYNEYLTGLRVKLSGATIGDGLTAQYTISQAGTLGFEGVWHLAGSGGTHAVSFNGGGVVVCH